MELVRDESVYSESNMRYIENEYIKLGFNIAIGGAITYLAEHGKENMINSHDWGRQIQMSYYSGPSPFSPKGIRKRKEWIGFRWNPIQSGDCFFNKSKVIDLKFTKDTAYIKCIPMQWALENYPGDCTFEVWAKLNGKTVDFTCRLNNDRIDKTQYPGSVEAPAVYTTGKYYKNVIYAGNQPFENQPLTEICNKENRFGWSWLHNITLESWAALVDDDNYGLGIFYPTTTYIKSGFTPVEMMGEGGEKDDPTGYVAPMINHFVCDYNVIHSYNYSLIVGDLDFIRSESYKRKEKALKEKFVFDKERLDFSYINISDNGYPINGCLDMNVEENSVLLSPHFLIDKKKMKIEIEMSFDGIMGGDFSLRRYDGLDETNQAIITKMSRQYKIKGTGEREKYTFNIFEKDACFSGFELSFLWKRNIKIYSIEIK